MIDWDGMLHWGDAPAAVSAKTEQGPALQAIAPALPVMLPGIDSAERAGDNRRRCAECGSLARNGRCLAAARGEIVASRSYAPAPDWLRRCEGFQPLPNDPDQRHGRDRWPGIPGIKPK